MTMFFNVSKKLLIFLWRPWTFLQTNFLTARWATHFVCLVFRLYFFFILGCAGYFLKKVEGAEFERGREFVPGVASFKLFSGQRDCVYVYQFMRG
jgi:hypothetical protein